jgi:hypothetical protein
MLAVNGEPDFVSIAFDPISTAEKKNARTHTGAMNPFPTLGVFVQ